MKKILLLLSLTGLFLFLTGCSKQAQQVTPLDETKTTNTTAEKKALQTIKTAVPTVFVHGYSGTINSFGRMLQRFESAGIAEKELILTVDPDGKVTSQGQLTGKKDDPTVQVIFVDNKNNEWNQAAWLKNALNFLVTEYGTAQINLVGHSMGGVCGFRYLETYQQTDGQPQVMKYAALGAPFNDFMDTSETQTIDDVMKNGPDQISARLQDFMTNIDKVDQNMPILLVAGKLDDSQLSDGVVPLTSALAIQHLLTVHGNPLTTEVIPGTEHSELHENTQVDQLVADFLWPQVKDKK